MYRCGSRNGIGAARFENALEFISLEEGAPMALSALPEAQDILRYVKALRPYETVLQEKLRKESIAMGADKLYVDPDQAAVLAVLIGLMEAKSVLELETSTGYNALRMAQALSGTGRLMTCACMEKWAALAQRYWRKAKVEQRIKCCTGPVGVAMAVYESHVGQGRWTWFSSVRAL
jgi:predicted O-methyltransferase YrrM